MAIESPPDRQIPIVIRRSFPSVKSHAGRPDANAGTTSFGSDFCHSR